MGAGSDGWIRVWDLESIFNAKTISSEQSVRSLFRLDPMNEILIEAGAVLKSIVKSKNQADDQTDWIIQVSAFLQNRRDIDSSERVDPVPGQPKQKIVSG